MAAMAESEREDILVSGHVVRMIRDEWMVSQAAFAKLIGVSREWVVMSERLGERRIRRKTLNLLADRLGMAPREATSLLHKLGRYSFERKERDGVKIPGPVTGPIMRIVDDNVEPYSEEKLLPIPQFELAVAAGGWVEIEGVAEVVNPRQMEQGLFRIRIRGDSMTSRKKGENSYPDGSIVEFRCVRLDREGLVEGQDFYVQRDDGRATFKRVEAQDEDSVTLRALNRAKYPEPMVVERPLIVRVARAVNIILPVK